jgi:hypothetical protein
LRTWRSILGAALAVALSASTPGSAAAFGTIDSGGQNREHERITRAALSCAADTASEAECFEPRSMDSLAGHVREFGAVGAPDRDELSLPAAHCDNADFMTGTYPRTRDQATDTLLDCVNQLRLRFREGAESANAILDGKGNVLQEEVGLDTECNSTDAGDARAKCATIEGFGRVLHGAQDFYSHSNWADEPDPAQPIGVDNPPGMNLPGPSPVLDLRSSAPASVPPELTGGCYALRDQVPGVGECTGRITHAGLNKDRGLIDPSSGKASDPTTRRGMVRDNFAKAVAGAIAETRRQWQDFQSELTERYGPERAQTMICTLTHDNPASECQGHPWRTAVIGIIVALGAAIAVAATLMLRIRRRRNHRPGARSP